MKKILFTVLFLGGLVSLRAEEVPDSLSVQKKVTIEEVVVTGTRNETDVRHLPMTVSVVNREHQLVQHEPFTSTQKAIEEGQDIKSTTQLVELSSQRMMVKDTDKGRELMIQIEDLKKLLVAYRTGLIKEKSL